MSKFQSYIQNICKEHGKNVNKNFIHLLVEIKKLQLLCLVTLPFTAADKSKHYNN